jgi:glycosyltransferase involved in cell wall biosynthesis
MKISAILPCRNEEKYLEETLKTLLGQTRMPDEVLYATCSTDRSDEIFNSYAKQFEDKGCTVRILVQEPGVLKFNESVAESTGEFFCCCPTNDIYLPRFFEAQEKALIANPDCSVAYSNYYVTLDGSYHLSDYYSTKDYEKAFRKGFCPLSGHSMTRKSMFMAVGGYKPYEETGKGEDHDLWVRGIEAGYKYVYVPEFLFKFRHHKLQHSQNDRPGFDPKDRKRREDAPKEI